MGGLISSCAVFCDGRFGGGPAGATVCGLDLVGYLIMTYRPVRRRCGSEMMIVMMMISMWWCWWYMVVVSVVI